MILRKNRRMTDAAREFVCRSKLGYHENIFKTKRVPVALVNL